MGFWDLFKRQDINQDMETYRSTPGAVLLDVRSEGEYQQGHIPGSIHVDVDTIHQTPEVVPDKNTPLFVYCHSGGRAGRAVAALYQMGYEQAVNIGGISQYSGTVER